MFVLFCICLLCVCFSFCVLVFCVCFCCYALCLARDRDVLRFLSEAKTPTKNNNTMRLATGIEFALVNILGLPLQARVVDGCSDVFELGSLCVSGQHPWSF